jgi:hypothetical protein
MFAPKFNSLKKSGKVVGVPPEYPEIGGMQSKKTGSPARKSTLSVKKPGRK